MKCQNRLTLTVLAFGLCISFAPTLAAPSTEHENAVATMAEHPEQAARVLSHPKDNSERLDYALFLHAFRPASPERNAEIRRVLEPVMAAIADGDQWGMGEIGPFGAYDGSDENMVAIIRAASLSDVAFQYDIPCDVLVRRPALIEATSALFGSNGDNFLPNSGCGSRGDVDGFPAAIVDAYLREAERTDIQVWPRGTLWYGIRREQTRVRTRMIADPRSFMNNADPETDYPYQNWAYLGLDNYAIAQNIRAKYSAARISLSAHYQHRGMSPKVAMATAIKALFSVPLGANCGDGNPSISLRMLIMDGAPNAKIRAFIASGKWKDKSSIESIFACAKFGDIDPMAHIAIRNPETWRMVSKLAHTIPKADWEKYDLVMDVDAPNSFGKTPLMTAVQRNMLKSAKLLLGAGANVNATSNEHSLCFAKRSALHYAAQSGSISLIRLLIDRNADPSAKDVRGDSCWLSAPQIHGDSKGGLRPIDYLEGRGPVDANPNLSAEERTEAARLLSQ
jgi:hypothetical protein